MNLKILLLMTMQLSHCFTVNKYPHHSNLQTRKAIMSTDPGDEDGFWEERLMKARRYRLQNKTNNNKKKYKPELFERTLNRQLNKYDYLYDIVRFNHINITNGNYSVPL